MEHLGASQHQIIAGQPGKMELVLSSHVKKEDDTVDGHGVVVTTNSLGAQIEKRRHATITKVKEEKAESCDEKQGQNKRRGRRNKADVFDGDGDDMTIMSLVTQRAQKRRGVSVTIGKIEGNESESCEEQGQSRGRNRSQHTSPHQRWSAERYQLAQQRMLEIMKAEGAVFGNPISRQELRVSARKRIGDTGLLDHLLKHIDGKITPGGAERFRRWHNTNGVMEYWLESADLDDIRKEAGVSDPYWIPPPGWKQGVGFQLESVPMNESKWIKAEMAKLKSEMVAAVFRKLRDEQAKAMKDIHRELVQMSTVAEKRISEIQNSVNSIQGMHRDFMTWKTKVEKQLLDISNAVSSMEAKREGTGDKWDEWLEAANLDNVQGEDLAPWLENTGLLTGGQENGLSSNFLVPAPQLKVDDSSSTDAVYTRELNMLKEEVADIKRDVQELISKKQEEEQPHGTPESVVSANAKLDGDNSSFLLQEMCSDIATWKVQMERQLFNISNSVRSILASKQFPGFGPPLF